jgi:hypothetical protein
MVLRKATWRRYVVFCGGFLKSIRLFCPGSRATGNCKPCSIVDIHIKGEAVQYSLVTGISCIWNVFFSMLIIMRIEQCLPIAAK